MTKSLTEIAKKILSEEASDTVNKNTLRPGSGLKEAPFSNPGAEKPSAPENKVEDLGPAAEKNTDIPPSAKAANSVTKDTSKSSQSAVKGESGEKLSEDEEMDEEIEISEELQDFIDQKIEEGLSEEEIAAAIDENFDFVAEEEEVEEDYQIDMSEHVEALLSGEDLSEEFKQKATTIFESAVRQKVDEKIAVMEEAYAQALTEQVSLIKEELSNDVDSYLNYVVEQWVGDNELAIESSLKTELTEEFITGLRQLFAENYIDIPEEKVSVVEEMAEKLSELENKLNEEIERNVALTQMLNESEKENIIDDLCEGLTVSQAEKLKTLAEGLEFTNAKDFIPKVTILRESYFKAPASTQNVLDNNEVDTGSSLITEGRSGPMEKYVRALGKTLPR